MKSYEKNEVEINPDDGQSSASLRHKTADLSVDGDHCLSVDGDRPGRPTFHRQPKTTSIDLICGKIDHDHESRTWSDFQ